MDFEILIGREVKGVMDIVVPNQYNKVGRVHAKITSFQNRIFIEDLSSANGTFINGRRVSKKEMHPNDVVFLGSKESFDSFQITVPKIMEDIKKVEIRQKTDFTTEFKTLVDVYNQFTEEQAKIIATNQQKSQMPKILLAIGIGVVLLIITASIKISADTQKYIYPIIMLATAVGSIVSLKGNAKNDSKEQLVDLEIKYQDQYKCPKCGKKYNLNTHWKKLANDKKCPHGCGAVFSH